MRRALLGLALCGVALALPSCRGDSPASPDDVNDTVDDTQVVPVENVAESDDYELDLAGAVTISLDGGSITASGPGVTVEGTTATITTAGTYVLQGTLADGQVRVDAGPLAKVKLVLNGVTINTSDDAPIMVKNAAKAIVYLAPDTVNTLTDGPASTRDGAIHCKTRLSIFGPGRLVATGQVDDGINAQGGIIVEDGIFDIQSLESGIKSDLNVIVNGGTYTIAAGNDGIHGETSLTVNGGDITVSRCVEGLEGATVTIGGGTIHVASSDDGINASSGTEAGGGPGGPPPGMAGAGDNPFYMRGGYVYVNAAGDGLDINGPVEMTGGTVLVDGPTANNNGALDYTGEFKVTAGTLVAVGSAGMAMAPSDSSTQCSIGVAFGSVQSAGTLVHVRRDDGREVITFSPAKSFQTVVLSSPLLQEGTTYQLYLGGASTGTAKDGVLSGGVYYGGSQQAEFTLSDTVTIVRAS